MSDFDLAIIGGGINGAGIARDAAGRGLRVLLVEQGDLAAATSSASTKLIHGGLRYLEHGALRLVREALIEREVLLRIAPHLVRPMRFVLPHHEGLRPAWMLRIGLFLYDHIGGRKLLPPTRTVDLRADPLGAPLQPKYVRGFAYSDCWVDDARLVVLNAVDAAERSASIRTRTRCTAARREGREWRLTLAHGDAPAETVTARALVNATGPWVAHLNEAVLGVAAPARVRLVKGSHIIVPRLFAHDHAYIFQAQDGRIVFAIPYEHDFTLIGTTDIDYAGEPGAVTCSDEEIAYLCRVASDYFKTGVAPASVVWTYSGVRPLYDDGASKAKDATRDYVLVLDAAEDAAPVLMVFGGKITTYRRLAEETLAKLAPHLPMAGAWTAAEPLPGGDFAWDGIEALTARCRTRWPFLQPAEVLRMVRAYGTRIDAVLGDPARGESPVIPGSGLREAELHYLMTREWAMTAEDVLWRRTKLGLRGGDSAAAALTLAMERESSRQPAE